MNLTRHAQERFRRRNISLRSIEAALSTGREVWRRNGAFLVMHGALRVVYNPNTDTVITAWWTKRDTRKGRGRGRKRD